MIINKIDLMTILKNLNFLKDLSLYNSPSLIKNRIPFQVTIIIIWNMTIMIIIKIIKTMSNKKKGIVYQLNLQIIV